MWWDSQRGENSAFEVKNDVPTCGNRAGQDGIKGDRTRLGNGFKEMLEAVRTLHAIGASGSAAPASGVVVQGNNAAGIDPCNDAEIEGHPSLIQAHGEVRMESDPKRVKISQEVQMVMGMREK